MLSILSPVRIKCSQPAKCMIVIMVMRVQLRLQWNISQTFFFFFKRSLKKVLLYTEAPRLVEQEISECPHFFWGGGGGGGHRRGRLSPFSLPFTLLSLRLSPSLHFFSHPFHPSQSLLSPALRRTLSNRLNDGLRGGIQWEWEWEKGREKVDRDGE